MLQQPNDLNQVSRQLAALTSQLETLSTNNNNNRQNNTPNRRVFNQSWNNTQPSTCYNCEKLEHNDSGFKVLNILDFELSYKF